MEERRLAKEQRALLSYGVSDERGSAAGRRGGLPSAGHTCEGAAAGPWSSESAREKPFDSAEARRVEEEFTESRGRALDDSALACTCATADGRVFEGRRHT